MEKEINGKKKNGKKQSEEKESVHLEKDIKLIINRYWPYYLKRNYLNVYHAIKRDSRENVI